MALARLDIPSLMLYGGAIMPETLRWLWRPETELPHALTKDNLGGDEGLVGP